MGGGGGGGESPPSSSSSSSPSSSIDSISNNRPSFSSVSSSVSLPPNTNRSCLSTVLRLGPSISNTTGSPRDRRFDRLLLRKGYKQSQPNNLFVKVYMEGISIGRKLDLFAHGGYDGLVTTLSHMFKTAIACSDPHIGHSGADHILTYEDEDGDWMMVGDVPWEMFLNTVKRLKITRGDRC